MKNIIKNTIKELIDAWDPYDLLAFAPDDEYSNEINDIYELLKQNKNISEVDLKKYIVERFDFEDIAENKQDIDNLIIELIKVKWCVIIIESWI